MSTKEAYPPVGDAAKFFSWITLYYQKKKSQLLFQLVLQEKRETSLRRGGHTEFKPQKIPNPNSCLDVKGRPHITEAMLSQDTQATAHLHVTQRPTDQTMSNPQ